MECGDQDPVERALREVSNSLTALMGTLRMIQECGDVGSTHLDRCLGLSRRMAKGVERLSSARCSSGPDGSPSPGNDAESESGAVRPLRVTHIPRVRGDDLGRVAGPAALGARVALGGDRSSEDGGRSRAPRGVLLAKAASIQPAR